MTTTIVRKQLHENDLESQLIHVREPIVQVSLDLLFLYTALQESKRHCSPYRYIVCIPFEPTRYGTGMFDKL